MKLKNISIQFFVTAFVVVMMILGGCSDEPVTNPDFTISGEPVKVKVNVSLPEMNVKSRAAIGTEKENQITSLWIRTYSSETGEATSDWMKINQQSSDTHVGHLVEGISTKSGYNYLVAVANVENKGVKRTDNGLVNGTLAELLEDADTWQDFLAISAESPYTRDQLYAAGGEGDNFTPLPMAGCYNSAPADQVHTTTDWETDNFTPVFIPASKDTYTLTGAIHLRRLVSHITFNLTPRTGITVTPLSYRICNVPKYTWIYERPTDETKGWRMNIGDYTSGESDATYYVESDEFNGSYFANSNGTYTFDFWQGENKHTALANATPACDTYQIRENENKTTENKNNGLYTSLTGTTWTPNNMASYVVIRCNIDYNGQINVNNEGQTGQEDSNTSVYRSGMATYVIHLGYCEGADDAAKAKDFNCRRNTNYTYNVAINGLEDIRVDAYAGNENYHGEEGLVADNETQSIQLDCHYSAFNVQLSMNELQTLGFIVQAFDGGKEYVYDYDGNQQLGGLTIPDGEKKYIEWVEFRPTTDMATLSAYYPRTHDEEGGKTFSLLDLAQRPITSDTDQRYSENEIYTVFVNEYTYETASDESQSNAWLGYVNQNPRRFYLRVNRKVSPDGQSIYARSKYAVSQLSIQTYYSTDNLTEADGGIAAATALGIEHANEMLGVNLRSTGNVSGLDAANGRYNVWTRIGGNVRWNTCVDFTKPQEIGAIDNVQGYTQGAQTVNDDTPVKLPKIVDIDRIPDNPIPSDKDPDYYGEESVNPQYPVELTNTIEAVKACMNRNRDNNGNGQIDADELRWYVPAMGKYLRAILGRNSLAHPIMDYDATSNQKLNHTNNGFNTRFLYYSSDNRVLWTMEGLSTSGWNQYCGPAWQVRCVRNLSTDLSTVTPGEKIAMAYKHDAATRTVSLSYYEGNSVRSVPLNGNGTGNGQMPVHTINNQNYNMCYSSFEYSDANYDGFFDNYTQLTVDRINDNPCSSKSGSGWRLPNQKELAIMRNLGLFGNVEFNGYYMISSTMTYYDADGNGNNETSNKHWIASRADGLTQLTPSNHYSWELRYRCVRDTYYKD